MKTKLLIALLYLFANLLNAQVAQDGQWYILDGVPKPPNSITQMPSPNQGVQTFSINNVTFPVEEISSARNDIFVIFDDGTYFNSKEVDSWNDYDGVFEPSNNGVFNNYTFNISNSSNFIKHLYYTNVYEDNDDPNAFVSNSGNGLTINLVQNDPTIPPTSSNRGQVNLNDGISTKILSYNHTIKQGRDITFIIKNPGLSGTNKEECNTYSLLWECQNVSSQNLDLEFSNVFNQGPSLNLTTNNQIINNRIDDIEFLNNKPFGYINLRAPEQIPVALLNKVLQFKLLCLDDSNSTSLIDVAEIKMMKSHDPNFVKLKCIDTKNGFDYTNYRIQWYNDGESSTEYSLRCSPPPCLIPPLDVFIYGGSVNDTIMDEKRLRIIQDNFEYDNINNIFKFDFSQLNYNELNEFQSGNIDYSTAYVEFCIRSKANSKILDSELCPLRMVLPYTQFQEPYPIETFYDICDSFMLDYVYVDTVTFNSYETLPFEAKDSIKENLAENYNANIVALPVITFLTDTLCERKYKDCGCKQNFEKECKWFNFLCWPIKYWLLALLGVIVISVLIFKFRP